MRKVVVGFSGGVTSAWCAGWALRNFPREEVVLLFHDTKEEHPDTYRFLRQMAAALDMSITERSDGRSVSEVFDDEGFLGNNQNAMCSRILKMEQGDAYFEELRGQGVTELIKVLGFSAKETVRIQRAHARAESRGYSLRLPIVETGTTKQECADWCTALGVCPSEMYLHFDHANCVGCVKGGMAYWMAVRAHYPEVFAKRMAQEEVFGHGILRGGNRTQYLLKDLPQETKRKVGQREAIEIGPCECGD